MSRSMSTANRLAALVVVSVAVACGPTPGPSPSIAPSGPSPSPERPPTTSLGPAVTLRLATSDERGGFTEEAVTRFIQEVARRSAGNVTIAPTFDAGADDALGWERGVNDQLLRGAADLVLSPVRSWDLSGVTSLRAFMAPFLITDDALMRAVVDSPIADRALEGMGAGIVGLTMWPEALRHLFWFPHCERRFVSLDGLDGATVITPDSATGHATIEALGAATRWTVAGERGIDQELCRAHGMETNTDGRGLPFAGSTAAANIIVFPKYWVLAINGGTLAALSPDQVRVLREAAEATQADVLDRLPSEAEKALAWCAGGGTFVRAPDAAIPEMMSAAAPVVAMLEEDPFTAEAITAIRALRSSTSPAAPARPCDPALANGEPFPTIDPTGYTGDPLPVGIFRVATTPDELMADGANERWARDNAGVFTVTIEERELTLSPNVNIAPGCSLSWASIDGVVRVTPPSECGGGSFDWLWKPDGDGIRILPLGLEHETETDRKDITIFFDRVWSRIG